MELISEAKAEVIEVIEDVGEDSKGTVKGNDTLKPARGEEAEPTPTTNGIPPSQPIVIGSGMKGLHSCVNAFMIVCSCVFLCVCAC